MFQRNAYAYTLLKDEDNYRNSKSENMGNKWDKFTLLMWKNWVLVKRSPIQTVIEILAPVIFAVLLVIIRSLSDPTQQPEIIYDACDAYDFSQQRSLLQNNYPIIYSPDNIDTIQAMWPFKILFGEERVVGVNDTDAYYEEHEEVFAGIIFNDNFKYSTDQSTVNITVRFPTQLRTGGTWLTNFIYPVFQIPGPRETNEKCGGPPDYHGEGFLMIQQLVTIGLIEQETNISLSSLSNGEILGIKPQIRRFPYPEWTEDVLLTVMKSFVSLFMLLSFVYPCINTVKMITIEKEKQLKESMKIMGLPNWLHWTAWFVKSIIQLTISIIFMVVAMTIKWYSDKDVTVFTHADPSVMFVFLFFYVCSVITFSFLVSVFFSKANTASTLAGLLWFLSNSPYFLLQDQYDTLSLSAKIFSSLGMNTGMSFGFQTMIMFEGIGDGVQWSTLFKPPSVEDNLSLGAIMLMLLFDTFLYLLIALYVEAVFPGEYGVPQPWNFFIKKEYWFGHAKHNAVDNFSGVPANEGEFFEPEPRNLTPGVRMANLRKVFGTNAAVRNLNLNMFEDQITVLLGHNGAGKTTTMSMLTGMFPPTSGTASVGGYDIRTEIENVRDSLGLCPQHNIIFDSLTVREHLYFFSKLKGLRNSEIENEIMKYIKLLELEPKEHDRSSTLSGGMKRKLCVGMALCGNSKVVMLDEPTAGMDPSARRALWELIQSQKEGRTILLTTHFMDEADLLGDRIAIMAGGELQCCGSSFFLKKKYGAGYHLIMEKASSCNVNNVTEVLKRHIPNIEVHSNIGSELTYLLEEDKSAIFEDMLGDLEKNSNQLGIKSYGISLTTLEEVFMKVGADHGQEEQYNAAENGGNQVANQNGTENVSIETGLYGDTPILLTGIELHMNQFRAMIMKKMLSIYRSWILLLIQIFMPVLFLIIALLVGRASNGVKLPLLQLNLDRYNDPVTVLSTYNVNDTMYQMYKKFLDEQNKQVEDDIHDVINHMLNKTASLPQTVRDSYIVGATFDSGNATAWFNNNPYHSVAQSFSLLLNAIYMSKKGGFLKFNNYPFDLTASQKIEQATNGFGMGFQLSFNVGFSMAFVSAFYVLFIIKERVSKSKHLQFVSGVKVYIFWCASFLCDFVTYLITIVVLLITLVCFQEEGFATAAEIGRLFVVFLYFGFSMIPMMYVGSYLFSVPSTGYTRITLITLFTGIALFLIVFVLKQEALELSYIGNPLDWTFLLIPHYSQCSGFNNLATMYQQRKVCESYDIEIVCSLTDLCEFCKSTPSYFQWKEPGIGRNLVYSFTVGLLLIALVFAIEFKIFHRILYKLQNSPNNLQDEKDDDDDDVRAEKYRIRNESLLDNLKRENNLLLKDVTKYYKNFLAVNKLCLGVKSHECFGLLGINGAGKTTTFKMMTGDVRISSGDVWVKGLSLKSQLKEVQKHIGYCPQFDALLDDITVHETIVMYALLRGIPRQHCDEIVTRLAKNFDFARHVHKRTKQLSGGNKRKLSTALALIGDPSVVYLDEPTTGMDPATKRYLWNALCGERDSGRTIILTSHSMEECEALCTRLAIMVNGQFKCLGSVQHLKNKFAAGYTLTIKLKKLQNSSGLEHQNTSHIENYIGTNFPSSRLVERHQELLTYYITDKSVPWSRMFGILEKGKRSNLNIEDYSLGQSSLEQVFLTFTKHQRD